MRWPGIVYNAVAVYLECLPRHTNPLLMREEIVEVGRSCFGVLHVRLGSSQGSRYFMTVLN